MSKFTDAMAIANAALLDAAGDSIEYWPAGEEADAITIDAIFTGQMASVVDRERGKGEVHRGELQIWADATRGVETPDLLNDLAVIDDVNWRVVEIIETVAGMHRLVVEKSKRDTTGRGRGWR